MRTYPERGTLESRQNKILLSLLNEAEPLFDVPVRDLGPGDRSRFYSHVAKDDVEVDVIMLGYQEEAVVEQDEETGLLSVGGGFIGRRVGFVADTFGGMETITATIADEYFRDLAADMAADIYRELQPDQMEPATWISRM